MRSNLKTYQTVNLESSLLAAEPHTVILMLFNGLLESIALAKGAIERKDLLVKSEKISKAINIIRSLQESLDKESEPKISESFDSLYGYCIAKLMEASASLELAVLDEIVDLIKPIRDAWYDMSEQDKLEGNRLLKEKQSA